ncbi:hypothetical protein GT037_009823 [Alternaria burnsii]|uniref:Uncharacterized protein n=1 Tax=Alternaria burnsii TaxID=1187904 RepID=A0A8H7AVE6_9PLEO|nr:uncharacterized protein GT037_009823 [Alternaria burnsii]KAF7672313.1 hypothetical protein GT037_009823 [Alternaria burnsii]
MDPGPEPVLESKVDILDIDCIPSAVNKFGAVQAGSFIQLRAHMVEAVMYYDDHDRASVCKEGSNAQIIFPDCSISFNTDSSTTGTHVNLRRDPSSFLGNSDHIQVDSATNKKNHDPGTRRCGTVFYLLLFTGTCQDETGACILVLGQIIDGGKLRYQRLGLGVTSLDYCSGPRYRKDWKPWQAWEALEEWSEWEKWFADTEPEVVKIV